MSVIIILLAASLSVAGFFLGAYLWSVKTGQFDDDYSPAVRILFENDVVQKGKPNNHLATPPSGEIHPDGVGSTQKF